MNDEYYSGLGLSPGVHLFQGERHLKTIRFEDVYGDGAVVSGITPSLYEQFARGAWTYAAMGVRADYIAQIEKSFEGTEETAVLGLRLRDSVRIDNAIQLYGWAFYHKERNEAGQLINLRWLDPGAMIPDQTSAYSGGFRYYHYNPYEIIEGAGELVPDWDLLIVRQDGVREALPQASAQGASSLSSQIVLGIAETMDSFYDTNGLPVIAVIVHPETDPGALEAIRNKLSEIFTFRRPPSGNKTIGIHGDVKIETISFTPNDLQLGELSEVQIEAILAAHQVPAALVHKNINRAELESRQAEMVLRMNNRLDLIIDTVNNDEDWQFATAVRMTSDVQSHPLLQKQMLELAQGLQILTGNQPIITVQEARERLGFDSDSEADIEETAVRLFGGARALEALRFHDYMLHDPDANPNDFKAKFLSADQIYSIMASNGIDSFQGY